MAQDPDWFRSGNPKYAAKTDGWAAGGVLTMELIPAGAPPGVYQVTVSTVNRTPAGGGTAALVLTYTAPNSVSASRFLGNAALTGSAGVVSAGNIQGFAVATGPLTLTATPNTVSGNPLIDVYLHAERVGPLP